VVEHLDVLVVGAGLSGIGAAVHLKQRCPNKTFAILEGRESSGGTWDLFRYPGIRSDSDMYTLGYSFKPWRGEKAITDGESILNYIRDTAHEYGVDALIRYRHRVVNASWSSDAARWTLDISHGDGEPRSELSCSFLYSCSGYYEYSEGYTPELKGRDRFQGRIVHPQKWTPDIDYANKRVVLIGSGATAMTLVPELAKKAAHVTMLQRSPTYVISRPSKDAIGTALRKTLPAQLAYDITRWKNVLLTMGFYQLSRRRPKQVKRGLIRQVKKQVGPDFDVRKHFTPTYNPWDQRLCAITEGDLFTGIRDGSISIVTDHIDTFTEKGILLKSGQELEADLIVTATGLNMTFMGSVKLVVDGIPVNVHETLNYKGMMMSDVPNLVCAFGYINASWTLKADLTAEYTCRLLNHMDRVNAKQCTPRLVDPTVTPEALSEFAPGYIQRALPNLPQQGTKLPWKLFQNYLLDIFLLRMGKVDDGTLQIR